MNLFKKPANSPILSHNNPIHTLRTYFPEIHFNIIIPSTTKFIEWLFPSGFPTKMFWTFLSPNACYMPSSSWLVYYIIHFKEQKTMMLFINYAASFSLTLLYAVRLKCPPVHPVLSSTPCILIFSCFMWYTRFHNHTTKLKLRICIY
jgi:hypothetical protein